ncbi:HWE histidine kinase domain-containing protein [Phenylobacterium sp. Root700]|uniref:HWE histidine kinase domain-containing protein n=1 Tax=Phenylobacterium sp. Root700 TaxID=1736591 RepID=UPI0006FA6CA4|nr:HWE histidine kinase domain-containing protein [Phenylobacterium sp. Root700]KRB52333.1 histidine kinase [Phenylobacterium sp. Root700]
MATPAAESNLDRERLELALQSARLGEYEWDMVRDVLHVSERMAEITGLPAGETPADKGALLYRGVHPEDREKTRKYMEASMRAEGRFETEYRRIREDDGRIVWVRSSGVLVSDENGRPVRVCGVTQDVSDRRLEEDRRRALMSELDHRVKNVLAAVQALAQQTAKRTTSLDSFLKTFAGRLKSMASANELLTAARWRGAAIAHLAAAELGGIAPGQTRWEGPELFLTPRAANALSLALHELATNAVKYGALSNESGRVDVRWNRIADGGFELFWTESGGPPVPLPTHRGFGATLLGQVTGRELNGEAEVEYRRAGVRARLRAGPAAVVERPETVPDAPAPRLAAAVPLVSGSTDLRGARVLIVEDAVLLALELETGLSEAGAEVVGPAYELSEAMTLLDGPIDAAVLDANLNGLSVTPVAEALAARGVPFVFATGYGEAGGAPLGFDAPVIRKPYDVTQVAAAVAALLAKS